MIDKLKTVYKLRHYIIGLPKLYSNILVVINLVYLLGYFSLSIYKIFIENNGYWTYKLVLISTFISAILLLTYYFIKSNYRTKKIKNIKSYLAILLNEFKLVFLLSNIFILLNYDTLTTNYEFFILILSVIYLVYIIFMILKSIIMIIIRLINFRKYIPYLKNKDVVDFLAKNSKASLNES